jgi:hypothetical protein
VTVPSASAGADANAGADAADAPPPVLPVVKPRSLSRIGKGQVLSKGGA